MIGYLLRSVCVFVNLFAADQELAFSLLTAHEREHDYPVSEPGRIVQEVTHGGKLYSFVWSLECGAMFFCRTRSRVYRTDLH